MLSDRIANDATWENVVFDLIVTRLVERTLLSCFADLGMLALLTTFSWLFS